MRFERGHNRSMKNNLIFTCLGFERDEATELKVCDFICKELGISDPIQFGNLHIFGKRDRTRHRPIVARFIARRDLELVLKKLISAQENELWN